MIIAVVTDEILKWCGLDKKHDMVEYGLNDASRDWCRKCGCNGDEVGGECEPTLGMNFFFQYVVPKLREYYVRVTLEEGFTNVDILDRSKLIVSRGSSDDPNKAWQEALLKLIGEA